MRIILLAYDLNVQNAHLMPWRTACEVSRHLTSIGSPTQLVSITDQSDEVPAPEGVNKVRRGRARLAADLAGLIADFRPDVVFSPVTWRRGALAMPTCRGSRPGHVGYFAGGVFRPRQAFIAARRLGPRRAMPYVMDALAPKRHRLRQFRRAGVGALLAMTEYTAHVAQQHGWPQQRIRAVPPGRDSSGAWVPGGPLPADASEFLRDDSFFLFMGPPSAIRGIFELLQAFDRLAGEHDRVKLVCLFREDGPRDQEDIRDRLGALRHRNRIWVHWASLERPALGSFMGRACALVLPFLIVPSEVPLAVIEAMVCGTPVITNDDGGTGQFARPFGLTFPTADVGALAEAMQRLLADPDLRREKVSAARRMAASHPGWRDVAAAWLETAALA